MRAGRSAGTALAAVAVATGAATAAVAAGTGPTWPQRLVLRAGPAVWTRAIGRGAVYALVSQTTAPARGPYRLERTDLRTGAVRRGALFPVGDLALAAGSLWIYGTRIPSARPQLFQLEPRTLSLVRSVPLPARPSSDLPLAIAAGPGRSVWIATLGMLLRVAASSGAVLARATPPASLVFAGVALDPDGRRLYVSLAHAAGGGVEGGALAEYDAASGRRLALVLRGPIAWSVAGAALTAVPGGVWASFRTGMLGLTLHFRERDLAPLAPSAAAVVRHPADGLFHWTMSATTLYGGGALWLANASGAVACLDARSGRVRALERVPPSGLLEPLAVDPASHTLLALGPRGLVRLAPPARCWG